MDMQKIGVFLSQLRKEQGMTQEQLGEHLGVSNKTVSRWETGTYLPPVEMLHLLSELYGLSINEILSGQRLNEVEYRERAEENIKSTLKTSSFTQKEKIDFYKRKWQKEHFFETVLFCTVWIAVYIFVGASTSNDVFPLLLLAVPVFTIIRHNLMMAYVEEKVYDTVDSIQEWKPDRNNRMLLSRLRIAAMLILALMIWITADLGFNYLYSQVPELNDGLTIHGMFARIVFGDDHWTREAFFGAFEVSTKILAFIASANLILACAERIKYGKAGRN